MPLTPVTATRRALDERRQRRHGRDRLIVRLFKAGVSPAQLAFGFRVAEATVERAIRTTLRKQKKEGYAR